MIGDMIGPGVHAAARAGVLNRIYADTPSQSLLGDLLKLGIAGRLALVSSFGAESVVLLDMVARVAADTPVFFLDTGKHFEETLEYRRQLSESLGLTNVVVLRPEEAAIAAEDRDGGLQRRDPDACCRLRKVLPLERALAPFDGWITGRKRFQVGGREVLPLFEAEEGDRLKVNPLVHWSPRELADYARRHALPRHPLVERGYLSIGCAPCTEPPAEGEGPRAGRWRGLDKTECGIHFIGGRAVAGAPGHR